MPLALAVGQLQPVLAGLAQEVIDRLAVLVVADRLVFQEEAAPVQVQSDGGRQVVFVLTLQPDDLAVLPSIQSSSRCSDLTPVRR
jgi:hypothetical protein